MTTTQIAETSVTVNNNSPIQDYVQPDDQIQPTFEMTPGSKPFTRRELETKCASLGQFFSLSLATVPEVFAKVNHIKKNDQKAWESCYNFDIIIVDYWVISIIIYTHSLFWVLCLKSHLLNSFAFKIYQTTRFKRVWSTDWWLTFRISVASKKWMRVLGVTFTHDSIRVHSPMHLGKWATGSTSPNSIYLYWGALLLGRHCQRS